MKRVNTFVYMNTELVKGSKTKAKGSSKREGDELEQEKAKKQKGDDDQEEAEMKRHIEIVKDDEVAIDAIPLATKPLVIVDYKIDKDGRMGYFTLIRADGSLKRPKDDYERVLWGDLKVMFEPDIKSEVSLLELLMILGSYGSKGLLPYGFEKEEMCLVSKSYLDASSNTLTLQGPMFLASYSAAVGIIIMVVKLGFKLEEMPSLNIVAGMAAIVMPVFQMLTSF
ncbi:hypothetical protein Tco_1176683 [Tanacetum coccineum]